MCDTMIALAKATADGSVLFAKNSDRDPNEAHMLQFFPASDHPANAELQCTYRSIPQVEHTYSVLLSKPFWMWGAEMGTNEHGVVIGNEAVFTRVPQEKKPSLLGMDLLRLGLERGSTARQALEVITDLLQTYGQGGNGGFSHRMFYHNSFLIGDRDEAWILETAGREWAAVRTGEIATISNVITIGAEWDMASPGLVDYAIRRHWCKNRQDFHFSRCYSEPVYTRFGAGRYRQTCTNRLLGEKAGFLTVPDLMRVLRYHGGHGDNVWAPDRALSGSEVCMHFGYGPIRINQTTGSMVSHLSGNQMTHWFTATSAPCTSLFKPVWIDAGLASDFVIPSGKADPESIWWQHERLHRQILHDYPARMASFQREKNELECEFLEGAKQTLMQAPGDRLAYTQACFDAAREAEAQWCEQVKLTPVEKKPAAYYRNAWKKVNHQSGYNG